MLQHTDELKDEIYQLRRERDSLARRCARRYAETQELQAEIAQLRDENAWLKSQVENVAAATD